MKYSKIIAIMIVAAMIFTATSAVADARFSLKSLSSTNEEICERGVMRSLPIVLPFNVNSKEFFVIDIEKSIDTQQGIKGYYPINLDEFGEEFKEDGLEVEFKGQLVILPVVSIASIVFIIRGYLPIRLSHIARVNPDENKAPIANFIWHPESPTVGEKVHFTDMSKDPDGEVVAWNWDFGDERQSTEQNPLHMYEKAGEYIVTLEVMDDQRATDEVYYQISVRESEPEPEIVELIIETDPFELCSRDIFEYTKPHHETYLLDGRLHLHYELGTEVEVRAKEIVGNYFFDSWSGDVEADTLKISIMMDSEKSLCANYIYQEPDPDDPVPPVADFSYSPEKPTTEDVVEFTDLSTDPDGEIVAWRWVFDNEEQTSEEQNPIFIFEEPGLYTVTLTVEDNDGLTDFIQKELQVSEVSDDTPGPVAEFYYNPRTPMAGKPVEFNDMSTTNGKIVRWIWDFGDGSRYSNEQNPVHIYAKGGEYTVTLVVYDERGLPGRISKYVPVMEDEITPEEGVLKGKVTEIGMTIPSEPVVDAKVSMYTISGKLIPVRTLAYETRTDESGEYTIKANPGNYVVVVTAEGYLPAVSRETLINAGEVTILNFALVKVSII